MSVPSTCPATLGSWTDLVARLDTAGRPQRWATSPALRDLTSIEQLRIWTAPGDPARADDVLGALVRLAATHADADATLVLLHLLWPGAARVAARFRHLCPDPEGLVAGQLAIQIRRFPFGRRRRAHAMSLLRDTQQEVWRELRPHRADRPAHLSERLVDPLDDAKHAAADYGQPGLLDTPYTDPADLDDLDLVDMLLWARRTGAVDPVDLAVLIELEYARERPDLDTPQQYVARARGCTVRTVQRRRDRALAALRACRWDYLAAAA
jgi:hypothetical protein